MAPLSPHLQIYRPFLTMIFSISSRIGVIAFAFSIPFFAIWLGSANILPQLNLLLTMFINLLPVKLIFIFWFFIFNHHLLNGFKYFIWSFAIGMEIKNVYLVTYIILVANIIMTIVFSLMVLL
jgi:succinate dehydrogenase / fumarate reductase cytochrome b subunit